MYSALLAFHSFTRWLVLLSLCLSIFIAYRGWKLQKEFTNFHQYLSIGTAGIAIIQLCLGLGLYFLSPIVHFFLQNFSNAVHQRYFRFFGMEHSIMMIVSVSIIVFGSFQSTKTKNHTEKHKKLFIWFSLALFLILISIPWDFSPYISRPYIRPFDF
ncbi:MAG: hypothetical protein KDD21_04275 [Bacteroidetes bacterium]|nr:hypothetical protein [Bacteroidota bacterium]